MLLSGFFFPNYTTTFSPQRYLFECLRNKSVLLMFSHRNRNNNTAELKYLYFLRQCRVHRNETEGNLCFFHA